MEFKGTKGEWKIKETSKTLHDVYSPDFSNWFIAENIKPEDAKLIAAAPENTKCNLDSMELLKSLIANGQINDLKMISVCKLMIKKQEQAIQKALK